MSCPDDLTLSTGADGELPPDEGRSLRAHLADCAECRRRMRAFEIEADTLRLVLQEAAPRPAPGPGLAWWLAGTAAVLAGATLGVEWLSSPPVPAAMSWLNPLSLFFGLGVLAQAALSVIEEGVPTMSPTIATLMVLAFVAWRCRKGTIRLAAAAALLWAAATPAQATETRFPAKGSQIVVIGPQETIDDTLVAAGDTVIVQGTVTGDLITFGREVRVPGTVKGSVMCAARDLEIGGQVGGDVYALDETVLVRGRIDRNVLSLTKRTEIDRGGAVGRDLLAWAEEVRVAGDVGRNAEVGAKLSEVTGHIGGQADLHARRVHVLDSAEVGGDLVADVPNRAHAEISAQAKIHGATRVAEGAAGHWRSAGPRHASSRFLRPRFYLWQALWLAAALLSGALLYWLSPHSFAPRAQSASAMLSTMGLGFLVLAATPIGAILLGLTVVGLPVALAGVGLWLAALYLAGVFAAAWLGQLVLRRPALDMSSFLLTLLIGEVILRLVAHVPLLGVVIGSLVCLLGLGLILAAARTLVLRMRAA